MPSRRSFTRRGNLTGSRLSGSDSATHGGVYVDLDFEALRPLDNLLAGEERFSDGNRRRMSTRTQLSEAFEPNQLSTPSRLRFGMDQFVVEALVVVDATLQAERVLSAFPSGLT